MSELHKTTRDKNLVLGCGGDGSALAMSGCCENLTKGWAVGHWWVDSSTGETLQSAACSEGRPAVSAAAVSPAHC